MVVLVTGGAGFIGSHLVETLASNSETIRVIDNLSTGSLSNLRCLKENTKVQFHKYDINDETIKELFEDVDELWHIAASADVRTSFDKPSGAKKNNIDGTWNLLEYARKYDIKKILFTSTSTVYGEADVIPTPEDFQPLNPISIYGMTKLVDEVMIRAYHTAYGISSISFRLANIIGERSNHGIIPDLISKLNTNKDYLEILGDGTQKKSYLHVTDCINAMIKASRRTTSGTYVFNIGNEDSITVREIIEIITSTLKINPTVIYGKGKRGWSGDVPLMLLDITKIESLGWKPCNSSKEAVRKTVEDLKVAS